MPEADGATIGGAIDFTKRVEFGAYANAAGSMQMWVRLTLPGGTAAYEGSPGMTIQTTGSST
jgi:hypothetical protein